MKNIAPIIPGNPIAELSARLDQQDSLNQELVALHRETAGLLRQLVAEQRQQGELLAKALALIAKKSQ